MNLLRRKRYSFINLSNQQIQALRESVSRFATETIKPKVKEMDEKNKMDPAVLDGLFKQGTRGFA
jgi:short/branched chain acyl-CoA dehydrogenase